MDFMMSVGTCGSVLKISLMDSQDLKLIIFMMTIQDQALMEDTIYYWYIYLHFIVLRITFFSSQGSSWISTGSYCSWFTRSAFRRHFYQHSGFRIVRSLSQSSVPPVRQYKMTGFVLGLGTTGQY